MPYLFALTALFVPRFTLVVMWLTRYTATAFETEIWPLLGFFFLPFTTCAYAIAMHAAGAVKGLGLLLVIVGVLLDFGAHGGTEYRRRYRVVAIERR